MGQIVKKKTALHPLDTTPIAIPQTDTKTNSVETIEALTRGKPSVHVAFVDAFVRSKRVQLTFSNVPKLIVDEFKARAAKANMGTKEYLYHLLRQDGASIPQYSELDARRRVDK